MLQQYSSSYLNAPDKVSRPIDTRFQDKTDTYSVVDTTNQLNNLLKAITTKDSNNPLYTVSNTSYVAKSYKDLIGAKQQGQGTAVGQDGTSPLNYTSTGNLKAYQLASNSRYTLINKGIDTNTPDSINLKGIISGSQLLPELLPSNVYGNVNTYNPRADDLIAFNFHDLVNDKYIPFRATVKGIQESLSAEWNAVKYINRADSLYTYGGFTRTLGFNFTVVISSIKELMPTWKRINYLVGLTKPANYTDGTVYSRFMIPPLIKFTIGDMYKNQPAVITQIGITIPENASWELLGEEYADTYDWTALAGNIKWQDSAGKGNYAQLPKECEITIQMNLLEKELHHTGGSNYGDYYFDTTQTNSFGSKNNSFSANLHAKNVAPATTVK